MQFELALLTMVTRQIMTNPLKENAFAARLKHIALMNVIVVERLHATSSPITLSQLFDITGLARNVAARTIDPLVERGILIEEMGKNSMGRGMAPQFQTAPAVFEAVAPLMGAPLCRSKTKTEFS